MAKVKIRLNFASRLKRTRLYTKNGRTFFGVWQKPEIALDGDEKIRTVESSLTGQLDTIAYQEYGSRAWWWAIAAANNIASVTDEVVAGLNLIIPKLENIREAVQEHRNAPRS